MGWLCALDRAWCKSGQQLPQCPAEAGGSISPVCFPSAYHLLGSERCPGQRGHSPSHMPVALSLEASARESGWQETPTVPVRLERRHSNGWEGTGGSWHREGIVASSGWALSWDQSRGEGQCLQALLLIVSTGARWGWEEEPELRPRPAQRLGGWHWGTTAGACLAHAVCAY